MKDFSWFKKEEFVYLYLNKFDTWDSFDDALDLIYNSLNVTFSVPKNGPYTRTSEFEFEEEKLTLFYHEDIGCCILGSLAQEGILQNIAKMIYGTEESISEKQ
ncbi:hypothetical protein CH379_019750 [Leptospira ellisii]|uniref:DUF3630 family protein n=1 Tax=Leptospira ellisii TaxID=2023197 RepID=A0A2N0BHI2_9LEPT|nr:hypothetical protein [Leptospira ellisii]MDV6237867.1 hypothetical protein [Leptospira ellisii]PJZ91805.1 hypothetical protein CH379_16635 [Leptospira ellisii]PKA03461.1 hypothetical protein CH375_16850 [Leptospira ellisii]